MSFFFLSFLLNIVDGFVLSPSSRRHTGMVDESKEDLMAAYKLDPNNKAVRKELQLLKVYEYAGRSSRTNFELFFSS